MKRNRRFMSAAFLLCLAAFCRARGAAQQARWKCDAVGRVAYRVQLLWLWGISAVAQFPDVGNPPPPLIHAYKTDTGLRPTIAPESP